MRHNINRFSLITLLMSLTFGSVVVVGQKDTTKGAVEGFIFDQVTRAAIPSAKIILQCQVLLEQPGCSPQVSVLAGANGRFRIESVAPGT